MAPFKGFIGGTYVAPVIQADAEEAINWYVEKVESPGGQTKSEMVLASKPGFALFTTLLASDFTIAVSPPSRLGGGVPFETTFTVTITPVGAFVGDVTLSAVGDPTEGISFGFAPNPVPGGSGDSTMTVNCTEEPEVGPFHITVTGVSGGLTHTATCVVGFVG